MMQVQKAPPVSPPAFARDVQAGLWNFQENVMSAYQRMGCLAQSVCRTPHLGADVELVQYFAENPSSDLPRCCGNAGTSERIPEHDMLLAR